MGTQDASLWDVLHGCSIKSQFDGNDDDFVPEGALDSVITRNFILAATGVDEPTEEINCLVDFVLAEAKKVFAISVWIGLEDETLRRAVALFKVHGFNDDKLPVTYADTNSPVDGPLHELASLEASHTGRKKIWHSGRIYHFDQDQWRFLAPVFSTARFNHDIQARSKLPFISKQISDKGSFGQVSRYEIHPNHLLDPLNPGQPLPTFFALKEVQPSDKEDRQKMVQHWAAEAKALQTMNTLNQPHIVRFITAFRLGLVGKEDHYLMFEWANGGNLRNLWKSIPQPAAKASLVRATMKQLFGLAQALEAAHYLKPNGASYRHGDLKPENILWFQDDGGEIGMLKIGDWGEAKEHNIVTELRPNKTTAQFGTRRYEAPEVVTGVRVAYLGQPAKRRSRLYDIWAMGCITLEFLIWLLYGIDGLNQFNQELPEGSSFYETFEEGDKKVPRVHSVVEKWMDHMAKDPACQVGTTALGDLLELVRTGLLVVKLGRRMGSHLDIGGAAVAAQSNTEDPETIPPEQSSGSSAGSPEPPTPGIPSIEFTPAQPSTEPERIPVQPEPEPERSARLRAFEFVKRLDNILGEDEDEGYWSTDTERFPAPAKASSYSYNVGRDDDEYYTEDETTRIGTTAEDQPRTKGLVAPEVVKVDYAAPDFDEKWTLRVDNAFATRLFSIFQNSSSFHVPDAHISSHLCSDCQLMREQLWTPAFSVTYEVPVLQAKSQSNKCDLCGLLWRACERHGGTKFPTVKFDRVESTLGMNGSGIPVLSIFRSPGLENSSSNDIQIGFSELASAGEPAHFEVIRQWLHTCDTEHKHSTCKPSEERSKSHDVASKRLPTRLIDVGEPGNKTVYLRETKPGDMGEWVALSHQWGPGPHFSTERHNLAAHINGMELKNLAGTFRDAVLVTRALKRRYLWIDSICIIQGKDGDFNKEANRMEEVYSGAYCVLAASCATGHFSGFLQPRNPRDYVALHGENGAPFYICETIDDFNGHVLEGALNRRGWVLQEHALARRTIFFDKHQTYWECGEGVRCETMTKMSNNRASLLGDPNFPQIVMYANQGERILRYQNLYRDYSRLGLSNDYDRPMAIDGLQRRLLRTMKADGGFGVFDEGALRGLLRRSLLWHRKSKTGMTRIKFPADRAISNVPSWSWMAYTGEIDYLELEFNGFIWQDLRSPWSGSAGNASRTDVQGGNTALTAVAREYDATAARQGEGLIILDSPGGTQQLKTMCVVLGIQKGTKPIGDKKHYLLVVTPITALDRDGSTKYERLGAGYLPGRCIASSGPTVNIY